MPVGAEVSGVIPGLRDSRTGGVEGFALRKQTNPTLIPPGSSENSYEHELA